MDSLNGAQCTAYTSSVCVLRVCNRPLRLRVSHRATSCTSHSSHQSEHQSSHQSSRPASASQQRSGDVVSHLVRSTSRNQVRHELVEIEAVDLGGVGMHSHCRLFLSRVPPAATTQALGPASTQFTGNFGHSQQGRCPMSAVLRSHRSAPDSQNQALVVTH
jgi:hypothetical protein